MSLDLNYLPISAAEIEQAVITQGKIAAIKLVRSRCRISLVDAKTVVESIPVTTSFARNLSFPPPSTHQSFTVSEFSRGHMPGRRSTLFPQAIIPLVGGIFLLATLSLALVTCWVWTANADFQKTRYAHTR